MSCKSPVSHNTRSVAIKCANKRHCAVLTHNGTVVFLILRMLQVQAPPAAIPRQGNLELTELTAITPLDGSAVTEGLECCLVPDCVLLHAVLSSIVHLVCQ